MLVAVAVKVTDVPVQIGPAGFAIILTVGVEFGFTAIVIVLDVAVVGTAQARLDVMITVTLSPFANALVVNVASCVPVFIPFTCH